jgi:hypothetical protein
VRDVGILEAANDVDDRIGLSDVGEKLVAKSFAFGSALDESGTTAGIVRFGWTMRASSLNLESGTSTIPTFGSTVQNG